MNASSHDPLHGVTLERLLTALVEHFGWDELGRHVAVRCFLFEPSIKSSLVFLRKTPWARAKVEAMYVRWKSKESPGNFRKPNPVAGIADPGKFNHDLRSDRSGLDEPGYTKPIPPVAKLPGTPPTAEVPPANALTPEEQMALFEKELKENDWGHQPC